MDIDILSGVKNTAENELPMDDKMGNYSSSLSTAMTSYTWAVASRDSMPASRVTVIWPRNYAWHNYRSQQSPSDERRRQRNILSTLVAVTTRKKRGKYSQEEGNLESDRR